MITGPHNTIAHVTCDDCPAAKIGAPDPDPPAAAAAAPYSWGDRSFGTANTTAGVDAAELVEAARTDLDVDRRHRQARGRAAALFWLRIGAGCLLYAAYALPDPDAAELGP